MALSITDLIDKIAKVEAEGLSEINSAKTLAHLSDIDLKFLSKKGALSLLLRELKDVSPEDRPKVGARANEAKTKLDSAFQEKKNSFEDQAIQERLKSEWIDFSLPARRPAIGALHPISRTVADIVAIFKRLGFNVAEGPEVELEKHNFDALNMPADHPARDMQDTFYVKPGVLLRTHTSPVQIRTMLGKKKPPVRVLAPGAVFRSDYDPTHSPMFHQVEGLYVDKKVSFAELKGCLLFFAKEMFGNDSQVRLRPSFFPFVEPGAEVDISCFSCKGGKKAVAGGCRVCKSTGWIEILGGGMVHPKVFEAVGFEPNEVTGFAFGLGVERIAMLRYDIPDLRLMFENDVRFLKQFGGV